MKVRQCLCGRGRECFGISAAFKVLRDPRAGYTALPRYIESEFVCQEVVDNNNLRDAILRHILPHGYDKESIECSVSRDKKQYIANHHFHPKIVEQSTRMKGGVHKCRIPMFISQMHVDSLKIDCTEEDRVIGATGESRGGYYLVPNYPFEEAKEDLKRVVGKKRVARNVVKEHESAEESNENPPAVVLVGGSDQNKREQSIFGTTDEISDDRPSKRGRAMPTSMEVDGDEPNSAAIYKKYTRGPELDDTEDTVDESIDLSTDDEMDLNDLLKPTSNGTGGNSTEETEDKLSKQEESIPNMIDEDGLVDPEEPEFQPPRRQKSQDSFLNMNIHKMDLALDTEGSYSFQYRDFDLLLEAPESEDESGVLVSTTLGCMGVGDDPKAHSVNCMMRALEANRKLAYRTGSKAYIGTKDGEIILYDYSEAPLDPPDYAEFEQSIQEFLNVAAEIQKEIELGMIQSAFT